MHDVRVGPRPYDHHRVYETLLFLHVLSRSVLVFGIWLAFDVSVYNLWDGWILAAIALWAVAGAFGSQLSLGYKKMTGGMAERPALSAHVLATGAVVLLLVDMIWKPGA